MSNQLNFFEHRSSTEYETPQDFFDRLNAEFHFTLDAAASPANAKCPRYFTKEDDGLRQHWGGTVWLNPPYDKNIGKWIEKAYLSTCDKGAMVVCLIQARSTETAWWHKYVMKAYEIRFIENRLHFKLDGKSNRANFGSLLLIFKSGDHIPFCSSIHA